MHPSLLLSFIHVYPQSIVSGQPNIEYITDPSRWIWLKDVSFNRTSIKWWGAKIFRELRSPDRVPDSPPKSRLAQFGTQLQTVLSAAFLSLYAFVGKDAMNKFENGLELSQLSLYLVSIERSATNTLAACTEDERNHLKISAHHLLKTTYWFIPHSPESTHAGQCL